jgi:hypothetical protein
VILAAIVTIIQAVFGGGRITVQAGVTMLCVIALLMIPARFYNRYIGRFVPLRRVQADMLGAVTRPVSGE